ncbi:unnamed protein product, partial [Rotaria magnacalcarata]
MEPDRIVNKETLNEVIKTQLNATLSSHNSSCNAVKITLKDRDYLFFSRNIWISEGARCCSDHLTGHQLSQEAIDAIKMFSIRHQEIKSSDVQL